MLAWKSRRLGTALGASLAGASAPTELARTAALGKRPATEELNVSLDPSAVAAALSALAAAISAGIAYQASRRAGRRDRESHVREVSLLANKVVAASIRVDDLSNQLKMAHQILFTFAGQGAGSSRLKLYTDEIEKKQKAVGPMQKAARDVLDKGPANLSDERLTESILELEGYLAQLERVREKFHVDLASVESQNTTFREKAIKKPD